MTCIAAVTDGQTVWMGGDSAGVSGWDLEIRTDEKVFRNGEFVMGFTSSFRMGNLLRYAFNPPPPSEGQDVFEYMVTTFIDAVRNTLKEGGYATKYAEGEHGGTFLVGFRGRLFRIDSDYQVGELASDYGAVGCGEAYAKGCLFATEGTKTKPQRRIELALAAAERHSAGVRGPFVVMSTRGKS